MLKSYSFSILFAPFAKFWLCHPLLWIGLHILLGTGCAAHSGYALLPLALFLWGPYLLRRSFQRIATGVLLFLGSWWGASSFFHHEVLPSNGLEGMIYFSISHVKPMQTPFGFILSYQGEAKGFLTKENESIAIPKTLEKLDFRPSQSLVVGRSQLYPNNLKSWFGYKVPCQIIMKNVKNRPLAVCDYLIHGRLHQNKKGRYTFKPTHNIAWQPVKKSHSFAEWRFQCKRKITSFIKSRFHETSCSSLFACLATGDIDERTLSIEFSRLGLSHILAISGFHFALLAGFILFCLKWLLPFRLAQLGTLFLISSYFFFIGLSPSVIRAFCAISIALIGKMILLRSSGINALGAGLIFVLFIDPTLCNNLGFQLSFLCTAALLFFYNPCEKLLALIFLKRPVADVKNMTMIDQHGSLMAVLVRKTLALTLAVHIVTLPVCLFYFSAFPLLGSLIYNLFFPPLLSLSIILLLIGVVIDSLFPFLGQIIHAINGTFTNFLLQSIAYAPPIIKATISFGPIPPLAITLWLTFLLCFAIYYHSSKVDQT